MLIEIEKSDPRFHEIRFCAAALSKNKHDKRGHVKNIKVSDGIMVATNGKRLHVCESPALEDGFYLVAKNTKSLIWLDKNDEDIKYPEFSEFEDIDVRDNNGEDWEKLDPGDMDVVHGFVSTIIRNLPNNAGVNYNYIEDALQDDTFTPYVYKKDSTVVAGRDDSQPIILNAGNKTAYIMPLNK